MIGILVVAFSALLGGLVQAVTGFGGAIIIMIFLPLILSMNAAPALSDVITMILSFSMFWRYRESVSYNDMQNAALIGFIGQFIGYYIAEKKGIDADQPRHLSQAIVIQ